MTDDEPSSPPDDRLSDEAIDWIVRLRSGRASAEDRDAFAAWRSQSPEHEAAALEAESVWRGLGAAGEALPDDHGAAQADAKGVSRRKLLSLAALGAGATALAGSDWARLHLEADHATGPGGPESFTLPDGSTARLNATSAIQVAYTPFERRLTLLAGQGAFDVRPDAARPFVVDAAGGAARAFGTSFDVDIRSTEVVVTVLSGQVEVATAGATSPAGRGERIRFRAGSSPSAAETVDVEAETAWRRGKLIFNGRPLADVVAEVERHRRGRIVIANRSLAALAVTGTFDLGDGDAVLRAVEDTLPARVTRLPFLAIVS
ncbi:FecR domain-containing protein [Methylopila sp. 73B]|uniref:FecR family protein n=1 Tax=Methylopila sp. 73B TaxID=1120792 RepID=UPI00035C5EED|nr:FecR domain-containing protein [Methylopila sp. 73B]